jgi:hypothetical protein
MTAPVMAAERVEHRKAHAHASSSGVGWRRMGMTGRNSNHLGRVSTSQSSLFRGFIRLSRAICVRSQPVHRDSVNCEIDCAAIGFGKDNHPGPEAALSATAVRPRPRRRRAYAHREYR